MQRILALGSFDGVHLGHRAVIAKAVEKGLELSAEPAVFCFSTPPAASTNPSVKTLSTPNDKESLLRELGALHVIMADFSSFSEISADSFIKDYLIQKYRAVAVVCGYDFSFGKDRGGKIELLRAYFGEQRVFVVPPIYENGEIVSSSKIRTYLSDGDIDKANALLCRPFSISGIITAGRQDGRKLGFPTLNHVPKTTIAIPAHGVYVTRSSLDGGEYVPSITDVGVAPTLDKSGVVRLETHLLCNSPATSPKLMRVEFLAHIRGEIEFGTKEDLVTQIGRDVLFAHNYFNIK